MDHRLVLAVPLTFVVRPLLVGPLLLPLRLRSGESAFVAWAGLKGAVPILLGTFILTAHRPGVLRIYDAIFMVVAFSVLVQGGLIPRPPAGWTCRCGWWSLNPGRWVCGSATSPAGCTAT